MDRLPLQLCCLLTASLASCGGMGDEGIDPSLIYTVGRGDLLVTVRERGEIQAANDTSIASKLEGRATLIYLIPEGTVVEAGEKVAELDVSGIEEKRAQQAIAVARAEAALLQARKNVQIVERETQAAEMTAETRLQIAKLRLEKFLGHAEGGDDGHVNGSSPSTGTNGHMIEQLSDLFEEVNQDSGTSVAHGPLLERVLAVLGSEEALKLEMGEMGTQILQQIDEINLSGVDLELAAETLQFSRQLEERGFIMTAELKKDEIAHRRQLSKRTVAWNNLVLLITYTLPETLMTLELEVENARLGLESVRAANEARSVRENADLASSEAEYTLAKEQLENWEEQIQHGVMTAPTPGLVVYGRFDWDEPVYEGLEVRERQEVISLPDISKMMVELKVPEAQVGRMAEGQGASIQVEAFPSEKFVGEVTDVSALPDPTWRSRTMKVYATDVTIEGDNTQGNLRPGMNCTVTVEVGTLSNVVNIPMPALERRGEAHFVWKLTPGGPVATEVELGGNNLTHVEVVAGLVEGDRICLVRPEGAQLPTLGEGTEPAATELPVD